MSELDLEDFSSPPRISDAAPGSVIASNSSAKIIFLSLDTNTSANLFNVLSRAPADCVPETLARICS